MLKGINPLLNGELLKLLDELGHGDDLVIADANFPAHSVMRAAGTGTPLVELPGQSAPDVAAAICTVFPIDTYEGPAVSMMEAEPGVNVDVQDEIIVATGESVDRVQLLERYEFYDAAKGAAAVVRTGEVRPYGNVILRKGVVTD